MREQKRKNVLPVTREQIQSAWRNEIAGDVLELWIGISRLMARMRGPDNVADLIVAIDRRPSAKRPPASRRPPRRKAA